MHPHFLANFAVHWNLETTRQIPIIEILMSFTCDFSLHCTKLRVHPWVFRSEIGTSHFHRNLGVANLLPSGIHSPLAVRSPLPSLDLDRRFLDLLCHSNRFGLLIALRKNFPEKVSLRNCHRIVPNLHASQPRSSQYSIHHNSSHHQTKNPQCKN